MTTTKAIEQVARADDLVSDLTHAAKRLGFEQGAQRDPDLYEYTKVDDAKAAIIAYIGLLKDEITELGEVAKGCAKREAAAQAAITAHESVLVEELRSVLFEARHYIDQAVITGGFVNPAGLMSRIDDALARATLEQGKP